MHANIILARRRQKDQDCLGFMRQSPPQEEIHCQCIKDHALLHQAGKRVGRPMSSIRKQQIERRSFCIENGKKCFQRVSEEARVVSQSGKLK